MAGENDFDGAVCGAANVDDVLTDGGALPLAVDTVFERILRVKRFGVDGEDIGEVVGEAPGDAIVVADDDERRAGKRESLHIPAGRGEVDQIPDGGSRPAKVRVVFQERTTGTGAASGDDEIVAASDRARVGLEIEQGIGERVGGTGRSDGERGAGSETGGCVGRGVSWRGRILRGCEADQGMVPRGIGGGGVEVCGEIGADGPGNLGTEDLVFPETGEFLVEVGGNEEGVASGPGTRLIAEDEKFHGKEIGVLIDVGVDAASVGFQHGATVSRHGGDGNVGGLGEAQGTAFHVVIDGDVAEYLGEITGRRAAKEIHLPEAVLRDDVALRDEEIVERLRANVGDAEGIAFDGDRGLQTGNGDGPVELRERAAEPPPSAEGEQNRDGKD